jgi:hypothetical protein
VFDSYTPSKSSDIFVAIETELILDFVKQEIRNTTVTQLIEELSANRTQPHNETIAYEALTTLTNATEMIAGVNSTHEQDLVDTLNSTINESSGADEHVSNATAIDGPYNDTGVEY